MEKWRKLALQTLDHSGERGCPMTSATHSASAGARFRAALAHERPLQVVGTVNAFSALLAERVAVVLGRGADGVGAAGERGGGLDRLDHRFRYAAAAATQPA